MSNKSQGSAGRFGVRYGQSAKKRTSAIEAKQKQKQQCIFCNGRAKRISKGIWLCKKCGKKFAGHAYFLERVELVSMPQNEGKPESKEKAKILKKEKPANTVETAAKTKKPKKSKAKSETKTE